MSKASKKPRRAGSGGAVNRPRGASKTQKKKDYSPYPGLNFYDYDSASYFAGRENDVDECGKVLFDSNVLVLHGATGCGKSSFLRAGVKPHIAKLGHGAGFVGSPESFDVIRSTDEPLLEFGKAIRRMAFDLKSYGELKKGKAIASVKALFSDPAYKDRIGRDYATTAKAVRMLADVMHQAPILVIDQAEEVFTLNTVRRREAILKRPLTEDEIRSRERDVREYFRLLREVAENTDDANNGLRLVISLRTEYKGQFDDNIARFKGHPVGLKGFYLDQLDEAGLIAAIRRPTLDAKEWQEMAERGWVDGPPPARPEGALKFRFQSRKSDKSDKPDHFVAGKLARDLLKGDAVPAGGVLPALQVACRRLYTQAQTAMGSIEGEFMVRRTHLRRLGDVKNQIHEYLSECIEIECERFAPQSDGDRVATGDAPKRKKSAVEFGELVDTFHRALANTLVGSEPDGRAVTRQRQDDDFRRDLAKWFSGLLDLKYVMLVMDQLVEEYGLLRKDEEGRWTLGHDSLALALNKWRLTFSRSDGAMMRMTMGSMSHPKDWNIDDLYEKRDRPAPLRVFLTRNYFWDGQLPHYAAHKGFAERLNIAFDASDPRLSGLLSDIKKDDQNLSKRAWSTIVRAATEKERALDASAREKGYSGKRVMVAAEWGAFPLIIRKVDKDDADKMFDEPVARQEVMEYASRWTDVLPTNINLGNGLIGPPADDVPEIESTDGKSNEERQKGYRQAIRAGLRRLVDGTKDDEQFLPSSLGGVRLLQFAADLAFVSADAKEEADAGRDVAKDRARVQKFLRTYLDKTAQFASRNYSSREPIVEHLLKGVDANEDVPDRFAVGGAFARALARQSGFKVYFGAKHVAALARHVMELRAVEDDRASLLYGGDESDDLAALTQGCLVHTLWTLGITPAQASFGQERASVLRLASVGYFTSEYARGNMDDFVAYIQHFVNRFLSEDKEGRDSMRGSRLSREEVRNAMRDCFTFARFDELGEEIFDLDSVFAYWSDHGFFDAKSMAATIYQDLVNLREQTLAHFQSCAGSIAWLRYNKRYDPSNDKAVASAFKAKERAWRHFRIFNFYDAERYMNSAAQKLLARIEEVAAECAPVQGAPEAGFGD